MDGMEMISPTFGRYRTADLLDKIALLQGTLAAIGSGSAMPVFTIIFGEFTDLFGNPNMATFDAGVSSCTVCKATCIQHII